MSDRDGLAGVYEEGANKRRSRCKRELSHRPGIFTGTAARGRWRAPGMRQRQQRPACAERRATRRRAVIEAQLRRTAMADYLDTTPEHSAEWPVPRAFIAASFAANRAAKDDAKSRRRRQ